MGETPGIPDTPKTPMQKATHSITNFLKTSFAAIKPNTLSFTARHERPTVDQTLPRPSRPYLSTSELSVVYIDGRFCPKRKLTQTLISCLHRLDCYTAWKPQ